MSSPAKIIALLVLLLVGELYSNTFASESTDSRWKEYGIPNYRNYSPGEYRAHFQNWEIVQNQQGVILVANNDGLLSFDGVNWRRYDLEGKLFHSLRSLAIDDSGTIYCGTGSHFGYLIRGDDGSYRFISLLDRVKEEFRNFNDVWYTLLLEDAVFFITHTSIFRWKNNKLEVLQTTDSQHIFHTAFVAGNSLYIRKVGVGLMKVSGDSLYLIPGGQIFAGRPVYFMQPYDDNSILIGTDSEGFFLYDGSEFQSFPSNTLSYLKEHHLYCGIRLQDNSYALGTRTGGVLIMDRQGNLLKIFDNTQGLQDNSVWNIYPDRQDNLWLALNNGISKVEIPSAVSVFNKQNGLEGIVENIVRYRGQLYVATNLGVYYLQRKTGSREGNYPEFQRFSMLNEYAWCLYASDTELLAGTTGGIYRIRNKRAERVDGSWGSVFEISASRFQPAVFYLATRNGVGLMKLENNRWINLGYLPGIEEKIYHIVEEDSRKLWLETASEGVIRVELKGEPENQSTRATLFDSSDGLPSARIYPIRINEKIYFSTPEGMFAFDSSHGHFKMASKFNLSRIWGFLGREDTLGRLWLSRYKNFGDPEEIYMGVEKNDGSYQWVSRPFSEIQDISHVNAVFPENKDVVWFGTSEGLIRYDGRFTKLDKPALNTLLRRVIINQDSIVFNDGEQKIPPEFSNIHNNLRFEFALLNFRCEEKNQYSAILEGFEQNWSPWNFENWRDYTNLSPGNYKFRVRGRDVFGIQSDEAFFGFTILPPWYRTIWAYLVYGLVFILGIVTIDRYQRRRLAKIEQQKAHLREAEIVRKINIKLNEKNTQLEQALQALNQAKIQLQSSESRFRSVVETAHEAIITADKAGKIVFWNQHAETLFGYSEKEALGKPLTILMPERYRKKRLAGIERFISRGETRMMGKVTELHALRKNGVEFPVELTISEWNTDEGEFITGIIRDISKRKQEQKAKEQAYALLETEYQRKTMELQKASNLQHSMLPRELPKTRHLEISAYMRTAIEVGGDYYDFHQSGKDDLTVIIGDATGHGLEAGMMVAATKSLLSCLMWEKSLSQIFEQANRVFKNLNLRNMYMGLQMVRVKGYELELCSAGMPPVLIHRCGQYGVDEIIIKAMPLGIFTDVYFRTKKTTVKSGDTIMLMSDGFAERFDPESEIIGFEKTKKIFNEVAGEHPDTIIDHFVKTGDRWAAGRAQNDDITFVVLKVK